MKTVLIILAVFASAGVYGQVTDSVEIETMRAISESQFDSDVVGTVLPEFTATDLSGRKYTVKTIGDNKITFINLWLLSCAPCIAEIPHLNRLYADMKDNSEIGFFTITLETEEKAREAVEKYDIRYPVLLVSAKDARQLTFGKGYPASMVLDKEKKIRSIVWGGLTNPGAGFSVYWKQEFEKLVKDQDFTDPGRSHFTVNNKPGIVFIDSLSQIQSFDSLADYFRGKALYVDLWASWCLPCREEFALKTSLDSFLSTHNITRLFISVDKLKARNTWKKIINKYQVNGYHLLAGEKLANDLARRIYNNKQIDLPRHIIVKNGVIVEFNAFSPFDEQKLMQQLLEKLF